MLNNTNTLDQAFADWDGDDGSPLPRGALESVLAQRRSIDALIDSWHSIVSKDDSDAAFSLDSWDVDGDDIHLRGTTRGCGRGCCPPERTSYRFPAEWLHHPVPTSVQAMQAWRRQWELEQSLPQVTTPAPKERL